VFLVLLLTLLSGSNQDPEPPASVDAPSTPDSSTSPDTASDSQQQAPTRKRSEKENAATATDSDLAEGENADEPELGLWLVAPDSRRPSCEELLGAATPKGESKERSLSYWKRARSLLMQGKSGEALEMMCLAGLYDKTGPATEGLSQQYLAERSLEQAERWVKLSLATDPERRRSKELLGDVQSQQGKVEQARKTWLSSMSLSGEETRTLRAISRKLEKDATLALRGGDLPRAERELRRAATLDPDNASAATALAEVLAQRGVAKAAILWAQRARMIDPNDFAAVLVLGELFEDQGSKEEAAQLYRSVPPGDRHYKAAQSRLNRLL
jgi:Tfp pilus assembly protein PilF